MDDVHHVVIEFLPCLSTLEVLQGINYAQHWANQQLPRTHTLVSGCELELVVFGCKFTSPENALVCN